MSDDLGLSSESDPGEAGEQDEVDLREYAKSLGLDWNSDADMLWVVREAFGAALPPSWTEHADGDGRIYFFHQVTQKSSWSHPMDDVYRELIELINKLRRLDPPESNVTEAVQAHLEAIHERATQALDGWSGPYSSDAGEYFYHEALGVSSWDSPVDEWRNEISIRQQVLHRCLSIKRGAEESTATARLPQQHVGGASALLQPLPALQLNLAQPNPEGQAAPPSPSSARSFATCISARSTCSVRSTTPRGSRRSGGGVSPRAALAAAAEEEEELRKAVASVEPGESSSPSRTNGHTTGDSSGGTHRSPAPTSDEPEKPDKTKLESEDELEITFGTGGLSLPKFGKC